MINNNNNLLIDLALQEDGVYNDITTTWFVPESKKISAVLISNSSGILCGVDYVTRIFNTLDSKCEISFIINDGVKINKGDEILKVIGSRSLLSGERVALNILQYMSGIATLTNRFIEIINNNNIKVYDTRKILPLYRNIAKYAVRCGGGENHRFGLNDMVLIKDNHLKFIDDLYKKVNMFRKKFKDVTIEIECENTNQVKQALKAQADVIMLDNVEFIKTSNMINIIRNHSLKNYNPKIEISGGVNLDNVKNISQLDIDRISIGMITHSVTALDFTLEIIKT
ncbi:MAG: carboxylating nicotinate-nucleotide diphosphorylase [Endomicrobium sp.]|jgi:nicotinate-nucleotide pyrophosphorylase (carboxylating)|nr:carboxylating nicotinate-nucleotide diphosphorylase [Endomicrobium sp.]